jgi:hypothetical protein
LARKQIWRQIWCRAASPRGKPPVDFRSPAPKESKTILTFIYCTWWVYGAAWPRGKPPVDFRSPASKKSKTILHLCTASPRGMPSVNFRSSVPRESTTIAIFMYCVQRKWYEHKLIL